jgi:hypothetical protein
MIIFNGATQRLSKVQGSIKVPIIYVMVKVLAKFQNFMTLVNRRFSKPKQTSPHC